ncbi:MAG: DUF4906 domain-containing protein [Bacteroidales bacterium]|nr:DUF4906 domain-containing protein [Bacteroidales bacterium]MBR5861712.1 DUF4906 domain-containing protein [Bacteroidales bacterium]
MKRFLFFLSFALTGCVAETGLPETELDISGEAVEVVLDIAGAVESKSSLSVNEFVVSNLNIMVYRNGVLEYTDYISPMALVVKLRLMEGCVYNIYVLANVGELPLFVREDEFKEKCLYSIDEMSDLQGRIPMACCRSGVYVLNGMGSVLVQLERLAAKITFSLDKNVLDGLLITSARLCQCASVVRPFKETDGMGSYALSPDELIAGDMATDEDLLALNDGNSIIFYALENCQGILLPDNVSPEGKVPDELGAAAELCTYLEVSGVFGDDSFLDGEVTYRFYLGLDACSSFDLPGNSSIDVTLQLTGPGLREVSWRVDADVAVRDGYAWGSVEKGLHELDDLYVGEKFKYRVEVADEILSYVGGDLSECFLRFDGAAGVAGDALEFSSLEGDGMVYFADVTCRKPGEGHLYLCGPGGEKLAMLCQSVCVGVPKVVMAEYMTVADDEPVESLTFVPVCTINGSTQRVYLYLADRQQMNLNSSAAYGFDLGAFDFSLLGVEGETVFEKAFAASFVKGVECSGGYAFAMDLSCMNDGKDDSLAHCLAEAYSNGRVMCLSVEDEKNGIDGMCQVCLDILPVTLTLVDNGWAEYHQTQLSVEIVNESELPLEVTVFQMVDNNEDWSSSSLTTELKEYVEQCLVSKDVDYITGSAKAYDNVMYVSESNVQCVGGGVLPLEGIEIENLMKSLVYDGFGQDRLYHLVDVTAGGYRIHNNDLMLVDALSDGSSRYNTIYYSGWNSKGIWLYSNDVLVQSAGNYLVHFPNLTPKRIQRMMQRYESHPSLELKMWYDGEEFRGYMSYPQGVAYGLTATVRFYGEVQGYVRTDPNGIWGSSKDNYCSATFDRTLRGVPLSDFAAHVSMDGGVVKQAMDAIYSKTFEDKEDGKKFQHSAHPVSMDCNVEIYVEGDNGQELYPMHISWQLPYVQYYHAQDAVTYTCQMSVPEPFFNMVHVSEKTF